MKYIEWNEYDVVQINHTEASIVMDDDVF